MRKLGYSLLITGLLTVMTVSPAFAGYTISATLYAGQTNNIAGYVKIWNSANNLYVQFMMRGGAGWCLEESHIHVATSLEDIPHTNNGNPKPGQFDFKGTHYCVSSFTRVIPLEEGWRESKVELFIAVHAVVSGPTGQETGWAVRCGDLSSVQFSGPGWSAYLIFTHDAWS